MILQRLFSIFKRSPKEDSPKSTEPKQQVSGGAGSFKPGLIGALQDDHKVLFEIVGRTQKATDNKNWKAVAKELQIFREKIYAHLLIENVDLYIYLQRALVNDPINFKMMRQLQKEMGGISTAVVNFLSKYKDIETEAYLQAEFPDEFKEVCAVLVRRIECEEKTLYPMYAPMT